MARLTVTASFVRLLLERALKNRYNSDLEAFLFFIENDNVEKRFPGSSDLVELTKYL